MEAASRQGTLPGTPQDGNMYTYPSGDWAAFAAEHITGEEKDGEKVPRAWIPLRHWGEADVLVPRISSRAVVSSEPRAAVTRTVKGDKGRWRLNS